MINFKNTYKRCALVLCVLFLMNIGLVFAHGIEEEMGESGLLMAFEHSFAVVLAIIAVILGYKAFDALHEKSLKEPVMYFIAGVISIGLIHFAEFIFEVLHIVHLPEGSMMHIEHILAYIALVLFAIGFYKLKK